MQTLNECRVDKEKLIVCFEDTFEKSNNGILKQRTDAAIKSNRVYKENFISEIPARDENASIDLCPGTTFDVAKKYSKFGKVAVLNFANPEIAGGGIRLGAMAQEECLCRSSNLYACISDVNVFDEYYGYHRNIKNRFYTDRLIYTKGVTVFKDDSPIPQMLPQEEWFDVDVITCAAPYLKKCGYVNSKVLRHLFQSRIKNIFESALDNSVDTIVLGAFGCGAFKNPAQLVAEVFKSVIENGRYFKKFKNIVFAIKKESEKDCGENYLAFANVLGIPSVENSPICDLPEVVLPTGEKLEKATVRFRYLLSNMTTDDVKNLVADGEGTPEADSEAFDKQLHFLKWQKNNPYYKKQFSVLGDSISTLDGYNPKGYKVFYEKSNCVKSGVLEAQNTWWDKVIGFFGGELLVNNSWSGSRVTKLPNREQLFPSGCSDERTAALHINDVKPDVILVYLGTNDWAFGAELGNKTIILGTDDNDLFDGAYSNMLAKIKNNYPESEVWCCTLCDTYISKQPNFKFPYKYAGKHIEEYNEIIRDVAKRNDCKLIDLYQYKMPYDSVDGSHPTATGMNTIATMMIREMIGQDSDELLDCKDARHEYKIVEQYNGVTRQICSRCGKTINKNTAKSRYDVEDRYIGKIIDGKYEILKQIGRGGFCTTYLAVNTRVNVVWAMKLFDKTTRDINSELRAQFLKEANMMKMIDHTAVPKVVDIIEDNTGIFIVMDYIEGETLDSIVKQCGAQPADKVIEWAKQICVVLGYFHSHNPPLIYRDVKPHNLILTTYGMVKFVDFGIMRAYKPNQARDTCCLGTMGYAAPEQFGGSQTDARTDIFGLGMTMFHLVTGIAPNESPYKIKPIRSIDPNLPKGLEYIITKCTQPNPAERYQSCEELLTDLNNYHELPKSKGVFSKNGFLSKVFKN